MTRVRLFRATSRSVDSTLGLLQYAVQRISFPKIFISVHPLGVSVNLWSSGGTLSAPTGCSPRDYGGLLAVDCSLYIALLYLYFFTRSGRAMSNGTVCGLLRAVDFFFGRTSGGTLSAPTGCSPRDCCRMF